MAQQDAIEAIGSLAPGPHGARDWRRPVAVIVVVTPIGMMFAGSFLSAPHRPEPHDVPVGIVASGPGNDTLLITASGRITSLILAQSFQTISRASERRLLPADVRPLPHDDGKGISPMFFGLTPTIPAIALAITLAMAAPWRASWSRLATIAVGGLVLSGANTLVAAGLFGSRTGVPRRLCGVGALPCELIGGL
jgi:hypothetical protein